MPSPPLSPSVLHSTSLLKTIDVDGAYGDLSPPYPQDTQAVFHFILYTLHTRNSPVVPARRGSFTDSCEEFEEDGIVRRLVRDTRRHGHGMEVGAPFRMRLGREFVVPALEWCVESMLPGEVSRFLLRPDQTKVSFW